MGFVIAFHFFFCFSQDTADVKREATNVPTTQPCIIVRQGDGLVKDSFLIMEKKVMGKVEIKQALAVLFASFYVFNVHYPAGCSNFYLLLESLLFKKKLIGRKPRLAAVLAELST